MEDLSVYNYNDIIYSCFQPEESLSEHCLPHHALIYVYSGEINITDEGKEHNVHAGEYVFLKKDNKVKIHKHTLGDAPYKAISVRRGKRMHTGTNFLGMGYEKSHCCSNPGNEK